MWLLTVNITLSNEVFDRVKLKLPRQTTFELLGCYYHDYTWDEEDIYLKVSTYVDSENERIAEREALSKIRIANSVLSYLYSYPIGINLREYNILKEVDEVTHCEIDRNSFNLKRISKFKSMYNQLTLKEAKFFINCCRLIANAIDFHLSFQLNEEASINLLKCIDSVVNRYWGNYVVEKYENTVKDGLSSILQQYFGEPYNNDKHKEYYQEILFHYNRIPKLNYKISYFIRQNGLENVISKEEIKKLVDFRNKASHGSISGYTEDDLYEIYSSSLDLAFECIATYFFQKHYKDIDLRLHCKI